MTVFVTGATGHLGANLVRALLARNEKVRVLIRDDCFGALEGLDVEEAPGDLRNKNSLEEGLSGCDRVYHTAAFLTIRNGDRQEKFDVNVLGTRKLLNAAMKTGVKKFVHCSSFSAMGYNWNGQAVSEQWTANPFDMALDYERTKTAAEYEVLRAALKGLDVCIVNPSALIGPYDFRPSLVGHMMIDYANGKMKAYIPGTVDFVPIKNVVEGHILAMEKGRRGERYLLSGESTTMDQTMDYLEEITGVPKPKWRIPAKLMQPVALIKDEIERIFFPNIVPRFNYHSIRILSADKRGDNSKAVQELGYQTSSVKEAFREAIEGFRQRGLVP